MREDKLKKLLSIVIENYIDKWDPIGSKFLHSLEDTDYAPSTLRKYLNILEQEWLLYQPYHSAGRLPTVKWLESYMDTILAVPEEEKDPVHVDLHYARDDLRSIIETLGEYMDGAHLESIFFINDSLGFVAGDYSLIMKTETCGGEIIGDYPWHLFVTSTKEVENLNLEIYPNPTMDFIFIRNSKFVGSDYKIYTSDLKVVKYGKLLGDKIDLVDLPSGIYLLAVEYEHSNAIVKFVKK